MKSLLLIILLFFTQLVYTKDIIKSYTLEADNVEYDSKKNILTALGHVELFRKDYLLKADKVIYNKTTDIAYAYGNILLVKPNGEELYAKSLELNNSLKEILCLELKARLNDENIFTAKKAHSYPDRINFDKVTYSPCKICKTKNPQWQIRSSNIKYVKKKDTTFTNNFFDIYGVPVFYFPYIRVPSYDAEPKSGFLIPSHLKSRKIYGYGLSTPYYIRINNSSDFIYSPILTTHTKILNVGKYRFMLQKENINTVYFEHASKHNHYHNKDIFYINTNFNHQLNNNYSLKSHIENVSDKSYLSNYHGKNINYLSSFINLNYLDDNTQFNGITHHFQELRTNPTATKNYADITIAPLLEYDKIINIKNNKYLINVETSHIIKNKGGITDKANINLAWLNNYIYKNNKIETSKVVYLDTYKFSNIHKFPNTLNKKKLFFFKSSTRISNYLEISFTTSK